MAKRTIPEPSEAAKLCSITLYGKLPSNGHVTGEQVQVNGENAFRIDVRRCMKYETVMECGWRIVHSVPSGGATVQCFMRDPNYGGFGNAKLIRLKSGWTPDDFRAAVHKLYAWGLAELPRLEAAERLHTDVEKLQGRAGWHEAVKAREEEVGESGPYSKMSLAEIETWQTWLCQWAAEHPPVE
jgi:hypothetical protein